MEIALIVLGTKANKKEVRLQLPATIGRSRNASLTVGHPMISRKHCELSMQGNVVVVQDLGSLNGTIVNGESIGKAELPEGGQFSIGPIIFQVAYNPDAVMSDDSALPPGESEIIDLNEEDDELGLVDLGSDSPPQKTPVAEVPSVAVPTAQPIQGSVPTAQPVQGGIPTAQPVQGNVPTAQPIQGGFPTAQPVQGNVPTAQPVQGAIPTAQPIQGNIPAAAPVPNATPTASPAQGGIPMATPIQGPSPTTGPDNPPPSNSNIAKSEHLTDTDLDNFLNGFQL